MTDEIDWRERALRAEAAYRACCEAAGMVYDGGEVYPVAEVAERIAQACDRECHSCLELAEKRDEAMAEVERVRDRLAEARDSMLAARSDLCALLAAHRSPSDAVRIAGHREAEEKRRGWGM